MTKPRPSDSRQFSCEDAEFFCTSVNPIAHFEMGWLAERAASAGDPFSGPFDYLRQRRSGPSQGAADFLRVSEQRRRALRVLKNRRRLHMFADLGPDRAHGEDVGMTQVVTA